MSSQGKLLRLSVNNAERDTVADRSSHIPVLAGCFFPLMTWHTDFTQTLSKRKFCFLPMYLLSIPLFISFFISQIFFIFYCFWNFLKILCIYFWREGKEREKERERNINVWLPLMRPPPGDLAHKPRHVLWPGIEPVTLWFTGHTQSTEPHQPGPISQILVEHSTCLVLCQVRGIK